MKSIVNEMIVCIVNAGFSSEVMSVARKLGVKGGTMIHARGTANKQAEEIFNISITPEKDMIFMVLNKNLVDIVLKELYDRIGLGTDANGIVFSLPVTNQIGLKA